jgi:superfamily II DNA or RNA helicase
MTELRPYQHDIVRRFDEITAAHRRVIIVCPTGGGKTVIAAEIIHAATQRYQPVLVLAHRREIITQTPQNATDHLAV